jgi:hypothetical protein
VATGEQTSRAARLTSKGVRSIRRTVTRTTASRGTRAVSCPRSASTRAAEDVPVVPVAYAQLRLAGRGDECRQNEQLHDEGLGER